MVVWPACRWLGWGSMSIVDSKKSLRWLTEFKSKISILKCSLAFRPISRQYRVASVDQSTNWTVKVEMSPDTSVTSKKSPNVCESCPKMILIEKLKILTTLQKLPKNVEDWAKFLLPQALKSCPNFNKLPTLVTLPDTLKTNDRFQIRLLSRKDHKFGENFLIKVLSDTLLLFLPLNIKHSLSHTLSDSLKGF